MITDLVVRDMNALIGYLAVVGEIPINSDGMNDDILGEISSLAEDLENHRTTVEKAVLAILVHATSLQAELLPVMSALGFIVNGDDGEDPAPLSRFAQLIPGDIMSTNEAISYQLAILYHMFSDIANAPGIISQAEAAI